VLLNRPDIQIGAELMSLKEFTRDFPPEMKGAACQGHEDLCVACIAVSLRKRIAS